jgi:hypothetical protein
MLSYWVNASSKELDSSIRQPIVVLMLSGWFLRIAKSASGTPRVRLNERDPTVLMNERRMTL